ncbi:MAG: hypothetical protein KTR31_06125 [Myxococcales bacterium]|nr:hypothetical protein [Myxococcales bacterium]
MRALALAALAFPASALAQTRTDLEYRETEVDEDEKLSVRGFFESHYYEYDNLDFRTLDETSDQAILDSDDRGAFAFTGAQVEIGYAIDPQVRFVVNGTHRGLWGDDQIGETNVFGGFIYFPALYVDLNTGRAGNGVNVRVGRQFYSLGGLGRGVRDYVLADVLDMVRVDVPLGDLMQLTLVPINVFSTAAPYDDVDFVSLIGQQNPETFQFRGDVLTRRFGGELSLMSLADTLDASAYFFYTDVHGRGTGADISYNGLLGNFVDNDFVGNYGVRASAALGPVRPFAEFNGSFGIDRKELVANDVDANGVAFGGGVRADTRNEENTGLLAQLRYFEAMGAAYGPNGLQFSHGYVGMKGQQIGGTLFNRFLGTHPTAYTSRNGISDTPQDMSRKSGTRSLEAFASYQLDAGLHVLAGVWWLQDTGVSEVDFSDLDNIEPPFGYSRSDFAATRRMGRSLGTEIDLDVGWQFGQHVDVFARGAVLMPGSYYQIEIDRLAGNALGSPNARNAWAIHGGTRVSF